MTPSTDSLRPKRKNVPGLRAVLAALMLAATGTTFAADPLLSGDAAKGTRGEGVPNFAVRTGYKVTLALGGVVNARFMEFDSNGILYMSHPDSGTITSFKYKPDGTVEKIADVVSGKRTVHGLCFYNGWLWFTTSGSVNKGKVRPDGSGLDDVTAVIPDDGTLPKGGSHWWRPILVDDDGFYTSLGDPNNITDVDDTGLDASDPKVKPSPNPIQKDREKIWHFNLDGSGKKLFISGIRNTEKYRFRPGTKEIWGCDHGSDNYGGPLGEVAGRSQPVTDALPGEELNHYIEGGFYGHPFIVDKGIPRLEWFYPMDKSQPALKTGDQMLALEKKTTPPVMTFGAHWANNGFSFLTKDGLGAKGDMLIAFHGSWNDTVLSGYRIQRVVWDQLSGQPIGSYPLVITLPPEGRPSLASPVDVVEAPDGSVLFTTDVGTNRRGPGAIYRISLDK